jgi:hypothetical protein
MKKILLLLILVFPFATIAQEKPREHLKAIQPRVFDILQYEIRLNPNDTAFQKTKFESLPIKFTPFFVIDPQAKMYSRSDMDSIINAIHYLFYEKE